MIKRLLDITAAGIGLLLLSPFFAVILFLVWRQDGHPPVYVGTRVGRDGRPFSMIKIRSMVSGADRMGGESTGSHDPRITPLGHFIRRWKLDELSQLSNVLIGDMSLVGPRPNTVNGVAVYTPAERALLKVRPGITDFSSIVFSDEGEIIKDAVDPDVAYDVLIRPWKSRLGLLYASHASIFLDLQLIFLTVVAIIDKQAALRGIETLVQRHSQDWALLQVVRREAPLQPASPPA
jgi:lipopolysaccharide/colanic/teichoic acid biosynthesis glycosyltransferase